MRKFKLYNKDRTESFDLHTSYLAVSDVSGLGNAFALTENEGGTFGFVSDVQPKLEDISLTVNFGLNAHDPYKAYDSLINFISKNGKNNFVFEYSYNDTKLYADVYLTSAPKSQIQTETKIISETFKFKRMSYWYELKQFEYVWSRDINVLEQDFPLDFPIAFNGTIPLDYVTIENKFYDSTTVSIEAIGNYDKLNMTEGITLYLKAQDGSDKIVSTVKLVNIEGNKHFTIDSIKRKVTYRNLDVAYEQEFNGYDFIDHNFDTFMVVPTGKYYIDVKLLEKVPDNPLEFTFRFRARIYRLG